MVSRTCKISTTDANGRITSSVIMPVSPASQPSGEDACQIAESPQPPVPGNLGQGPRGVCVCCPGPRNPKAQDQENEEAERTDVPRRPSVPLQSFHLTPPP